MKYLKLYENFNLNEGSEHLLKMLKDKKIDLKSDKVDKERLDKFLENHLSLDLLIDLIDVVDDGNNLFKDYNVTKEDIRFLFKKLNPKNYGELFSIKMWKNGIFTNEDFCESFSDLICLSGNCYLYVNDFENGLRSFFDEITLKMLDGNLDFDPVEWTNSSVNDLWWSLNNKTIEEIRKCCIEQNFKVDVEYDDDVIPDYPLLNETLIIKDNKLYVYLNEQYKSMNQFGMFGLKKENVDNGDYIDFDDVFEYNKDDKLEPLYDAINRASNYANDSAWTDAYYKKAKESVEKVFVEYEWYKINENDKYYKIIFNINNFITSDDWKTIEKDLTYQATYNDEIDYEDVVLSEDLLDIYTEYINSDEEKVNYDYINPIFDRDYYNEQVIEQLNGL